MLFLSNGFSQTITDVIDPIKLKSGETDTLLISDIFYAEKYDITVESSPNIKVKYENNLLILTPDSLFEGMELLHFFFNNDKYSIPVLSEINQKVDFAFKPANKKSNVFLFGSFNNWNRNNIRMTDINNDGVFYTSISLEPGRHEYKFYVDDPDDSSGAMEFIDPDNPEFLSNGFGGYNSVRTVHERHSGVFYLHNISMVKNKSSNTYTFYLEDENSRSRLSTENIFALINNKKIEEVKIKTDDNYIYVEIDNDKIETGGIFRIAVTVNGRSSNLQTIFLNQNNFSWHDAIIYSIMIDRFNDGDESNTIPVQHKSLTAKANYMGGDLQGIIDKINDGYFTSLGANTLWLSPVIANTDSAYQEYPEPHRYYTGYHGYWPVHPTNVEERFGDMELLKKLIETAHSKNIKVLLDYVANHIHIEHPFWKEHRDWFGNLELPDGRKNLRLWDEQRLTTWFEPYMPSFDFEGSEEALEVMTDNAVWWLKETGADGFRHDAVKHIPNEFWRLLTKKIRKEFFNSGNKNLYQIGETFGSYDLVSSYVNKGQLDAQFNFNLYDTSVPVFIDTALSFKLLDLQMKNTFEVYGINHLMGNVMDSHDKVRFMAFADYDVALADAMNAGEIGWNNPPEVSYSDSYKKLKLMTVFLNTIPGIPVIYYGDEFGMTGAADPDNRRMMRFDEELNAAETNTIADVRKIIGVRNQSPALRYGDFLTLTADKNIYSYIRSDMTERIIVVINKSYNEISTSVKLPEVYRINSVFDLIDGSQYSTQNNSLNLMLKPLSFLILKVN
ncbi:MAG: alpha-glucosidase C-terminal domain-containing protein [Ignavibacteriales bacterium]|nr:MAG: alpha-glucosidase C-terminal domain-containing protein [Ignavibacteriales bacterium]